MIVVRDESVARVFPLADGDQPQSFRELYRYVFHRMHGDIGAIFQQRQLKFFNEQPFTAHFGQGGIQDDVAARDHRHQLNPQARMVRFQTPFNIMCLPEGEGALPCGNS